MTNLARWNPLRKLAEMDNRIARWFVRLLFADSHEDDSEDRAAIQPADDTDLTNGSPELTHAMPNPPVAKSPAAKPKAIDVKVF